MEFGWLVGSDGCRPSDVNRRFRLLLRRFLHDDNFDRTLNVISRRTDGQT